MATFNEIYLLVSDGLGEIYALGEESAAQMAAGSDVSENTDWGSIRHSQEIIDHHIADTSGKLEAQVGGSSGWLKSSVESIQKAVASQYGSVDFYLASSGIMVSSDFAALSALCGYPISSLYVR